MVKKKKERKYKDFNLLSFADHHMVRLPFGPSNIFNSRSSFFSLEEEAPQGFEN